MESDHNILLLPNIPFPKVFLLFVLVLVLVAVLVLVVVFGVCGGGVGKED